MSFREPTTIGRVPLLLAGGAADRFGLDPEVLLREAGFTAVELRDADARIPGSKVRQLWAQIVRRVPDPAVGLLLAESRAPRELGLIAYTMQMADTLGEALHRLQRYIHVLGEGLELAVDRSAGRAEIVLERVFPAEPARAPEEFRLTLLLAAMRWIVRHDLVPLEVRFPYPAPTDLSALRRVFRCPMRFGQKPPAVVLPAADLDRPVPTSDEVLLSYLDDLAEQACRELQHGETAAEGVSRALWRLLPSGNPSIELVAARLGVSVRSLQRRLASQGTSFTDVLDGFRREVSRRLLSQREVAVCEVAFVLGYADPSAFHRAFRRWHGVTPRRFRSRMP